VQTLCSTTSGLIVSWTGRYRESILIGWATWAIGIGLFSTLDESDGLGKQIGYAILTGFGVGQTLQPSLIAIQAGVQRCDMAVVTATRNFVRNLGGTLGLAISGTIINNIIRSSISGFGLSEAAIQGVLDQPETALESLSNQQVRAALVPAYQRGFRIVFLVCAALATLSTVLAFWLMPQIKLDREDDEKLKEEGRRAGKERSEGEESSLERKSGERVD
jgi:hypothetical protein